MSNKFLTSACKTTNTFLLTISPPEFLEISTIPESFRIAKRIDEGIFSIELVPKNKGITSLAFLITTTFGLITISPSRIQDSRFIAPGGIKTTIPDTICNKTINKNLYNKSPYFEVSINVRETIKNYVTEGDVYYLRFGTSTDGLFVGDVTITRTKSPLFLLQPISA